MTAASSFPWSPTPLIFSALLWLVPSAGASVACQSRVPEPEPTEQKTDTSSTTAAQGAAAKPAAPAQKGETEAVSSTTGAVEPHTGPFPMKEAVAGLEGDGKLMAAIKTEKGTLDCELYDDRAPLTVASFVGLARGLRPFKDPSGQWVKRPAYDGTTFHRIVKGFMIQGGDPAGTGRGDPGFMIPDEIWEGAKHDQRGLLCMANRGPNTNAMQFFILDGAAPHLDGGYTIFGKCGPDSVIEKLASTEVAGDRALKPPKIESIRIRRGDKK